MTEEPEIVPQKGPEIVPQEEPKVVTPEENKEGLETTGIGNAIEIPQELIREAGGKEVVSRIISYMESFSGPVPHPRIISQYKSVMPDAPERIFRMAEKQQEHRFGLENKVIGGDVERADLGLRFGFTLYAILAIGAIVLLGIGKDIAGYTVLVTSVLGGVINFIRVGSERKKERESPPPITEGSRKTRRKKKKK